MGGTGSKISKRQRSHSPNEDKVTAMRNIYYGSELKRYADTFKNSDGDEVVGRVIFGSVVEAVEERQKHTANATETWVRIRQPRGGDDVWVLATVATAREVVHNFIRLSDWQHHAGRIPASAFAGQIFPHDGMYTAGYPGAQDICLVSASGDNLWRELNIEMLFRNIGTATVFEKKWGGCANFMDWVGYYSFNVATHAELGSGEPKRLVVTVKNTANYANYPKIGPDPDAVKDDIGKAQFKECHWLMNMCLDKNIPWDCIEFMTAFQFLQRFCGWSQTDCRDEARSKAQRIWDGAQGETPFKDLAIDKLEYVKDMVYWCLAEAFGGEDSAKENVHYQQMAAHVALSSAENVQEFLTAHGFTGVEDRNQNGYAPLHVAAELGMTEYIRLLKASGAGIEARDKDMREMPLHRAARFGHEGCVRALAEVGAYLDARDVHGLTPMHRAAELGQEGCLLLLAQLGANIEAESDLLRTPMHWAGDKGHEGCIRALAELGARVEVDDTFKFTPMRLAGFKNHDRCVSVLAELGARR